MSENLLCCGTWGGVISLPQPFVDAHGDVAFGGPPWRGKKFKESAGGSRRIGVVERRGLGLGGLCLTGSLGLDSTAILGVWCFGGRPVTMVGTHQEAKGARLEGIHRGILISCILGPGPELGILAKHRDVVLH